MSRSTSLARLAAAAREILAVIDELDEPAAPRRPSRKRPRPPVVLTETDVALARRALRRLRATP